MKTNVNFEQHPPVGGDTAWLSQYGLYDALSDAMKKHVDGLHSVHTSRLQYDTILDLWGAGPNRPPIGMFAVEASALCYDGLLATSKI